MIKNLKPQLLILHHYPQIFHQFILSYLFFTEIINRSYRVTSLISYFYDQAFFFAFKSLIFLNFGYPIYFHFHMIYLLASKHPKFLHLIIYFYLCILYNLIYTILMLLNEIFVENM